MRMVQKNEKGFTLVELLIVVAIIGILSAVAIPQFAKYKRNAAVAAAEGAFTTCASEVAAMYADNGTFEKDCIVGNSTITVSVNATTGAITLGDTVGANVTPSVKNIKMTCNATNNQISCKADD